MTPTPTFRPVEGRSGSNLKHQKVMDPSITLDCELASLSNPSVGQARELQHLMHVPSLEARLPCSYGSWSETATSTATATATETSTHHPPPCLSPFSAPLLGSSREAVGMNQLKAMFHHRSITVEGLLCCIARQTEYEYETEHMRHVVEAYR